MTAATDATRPEVKPSPAGAAPLRAFLVEPNPLVVAALGQFFAAEPRFDLTAISDSGQSLLAAAPGSFDLAVVAWKTEDLAAPELLRAWANAGRVEPVVIGGAAELAGVLPGILRDGDLLLMMGAVDIGAVAQQIARDGLQGDAA